MMAENVADLRPEHQDLINLARQGDSAAFYQLYTAYSSYVYAILRRHLGSSPHVEDLLQQVFLKIYKDLPEFRGDRPFRAWLRRACCFAIYDHFRKTSRNPEVYLDDDFDIQHFQNGSPAEYGRASGPEEDYVKSEIRKRTHKILDKLKPDKRMALVLHDFEGHTLDEVAEILGVSKFTVRTRLIRGRREYAQLAQKDRELMQLIGRSAQ